MDHVIALIRPTKGLKHKAAKLLLVWAAVIISQQPAIAEKDQYLTGQLLVATPEMPDPRFAEAVVFMVSHNGNGAMGLVINRPLAKGPISDLLKGLGVDSE